MENQTIDANVQSAKDSLMASIGSQTDWGAFKDSSSPSTPTASENTTLNNESEVRSPSDGADSQQQTSSQPEKDGITQSEGATPNRQDSPLDQSNKQAKPSRENARVRELVDKDKSNQARIQELESKLQATQVQPKTESKPVESKPLVPKPQPPSYGKDVLKELNKKARESGDQALFDQVQEEIEKWRDYDLQSIKWEIENGEAVKRHNGLVNYYKEQALGKWKELNDPNSQHSLQYVGIRGWMQKELPSLLESPVSEYLIAQIANWKMSSESASSRLGAAEAETKKLREENERLKKGTLPISSNSKAEYGKSNDSPESSLKDAKSSLIDNIRKQNLGFSFQ